MKSNKNDSKDSNYTAGDALDDVIDELMDGPDDVDDFSEHEFTDETDSSALESPAKDNERYVSSNRIDTTLPLEDKMFCLLTLDEFEEENNKLKICDPNKGIYKECYYYDDYTDDYIELGLDYTSFLQCDSTPDFQKGELFSRTINDKIGEKFGDLQRIRANRRKLEIQHTKFRTAIDNRDKDVYFTKYIDRTLSLLPNDEHGTFKDMLCDVAAFLGYYNIDIDMQVYLNVLRCFGKGYSLPKMIYTIVNGHNMLGISGNTIVKYQSKFNNDAKLERLRHIKAEYNSKRNKDLPPINLTIDFIMMIAKYLGSESDNINLTRVCKNFKNYISMLKYNPIEDSKNLFENKQTQCIYSSFDSVDNNFKGCSKVMFDIDYFTKCYLVYKLGRDNLIFTRDVCTSKMSYDSYKENYKYKEHWEEADLINDDNSYGFYIKNNKLIIQDDVTVICYGCFQDYEGYYNVVLPTGLTTIMSSAFETSNIISVNIPSTVSRIDSNAFSNCEYLTSVTFCTTDLKLLSKECFKNCYILKSINIPEGVEEIGEECFCSCTSLSNVTFPTTLKSIKKRAFKNTELSNIKLPDGVTELGHECFYNNRFNGITESFNLPRSLVDIGGSILDSTPVNNMYIPENFDTIDMDAFGTITVNTMHIRKEKTIIIDGSYKVIKSTYVIPNDSIIRNYVLYDYGLEKGLPIDVIKDFEIKEG